MKQNLKKLLVTASLIFCVFSNAQMVLEYNILTPNTQVGLPMGGPGNGTINWGDGNPLQIYIYGSSGGSTIRHTYSTIGLKTITISGTLSTYNGFTLPLSDSPDRLIRVVSWDGLGLTSLIGGFRNCTNLIDVPSTLPSTVTYIMNLFENATNFNDDISTWNVSNVIYTSRMFRNASNFNQPLNNWNVSNVTDMAAMFESATNFEQNIGNWNVANVDYMSDMFLNVTLCAQNYDAIINGWSAQNVKSNVNFSGGNSKYSPASSAARSSLITNKSWVITDAGVAAASDFCNLSNDSYEKEVFTIFPNPANSVLNINTDNQTLKLVLYEIYTLTGQRIQKNNFESLDNKINIHSLSNGNYLLKLYTDKNSISKIFIKE